MSHNSSTELKGTGLSLTSGLTDLNRILGETGSMLIVKGQSQSFSVSEGSFRHVNLASLGPSGWQAGARLNRQGLHMLFKHMETGQRAEIDSILRVDRKMVRNKE